jgi:hypothetical protein
MKNYNLTISFFIGLLFVSCNRPSLLEDNDSAYFNIVSVKIGLVQQGLQNEAGCNEVSLIDNFDKNKKIGICFRYKPNKYLNGNAAPFKEGGLVEKIKTLRVFLGNNTVQKEVKDFLIGEKHTDIYWRDEDTIPILFFNGNRGTSNKEEKHKALGYESSCISKPDCTNLIEWQRIMNNGLERLKLEGYQSATHFFWFTKKGLKEVSFKPTYLKMEMTFHDSTSSKIRIVKDSIVLK